MEIRKTIVYKLFIKYYYGLSENDFVFITYLISPFIFFFIKFGGFKLFLVYYLLITSFIAFKLKRIIIPFILTYLFTLQFLRPAKVYSVLAVGKFKEVVLDYKMGYIKEFGLNTSNIFLILVVIMVVREFLINRKFKYFIKDYKLIVTLGCLLVFLMTGYLSSLSFSQYFTASFVWLLQYSQVFLVGMVIYGIYKYSKYCFGLVINVMAASVIFQSIIGFMQFIKQSSLGLVYEREQVVQWNTNDMDMIGNLYRIVGTFSHPNELGLILSLLLCVILPYIFDKKSDLFVLSAILGSIAILLTQTRSVWIGLFISLILLIRFYYSEFTGFASKISKNKKIVLYFTIIFMLLSYIVIPRILLSTNIFYRSGSLELRINMLKESLEAINQSPVIGYGVGTNETVLYELTPRGFMRNFPSSVHVGFVQLILEIGLVGFMAFILLFVIITYLIIRKIFSGSYYTADKKYFYSFLSGFVAYTMFYLFQPHWGEYDFAYIGIILGVGLISIKTNEKKEV